MREKISLESPDCEVAMDQEKGIPRKKRRRKSMKKQKTIGKKKGKRKEKKE